jgi:peptide deformylase
MTLAEAQELVVKDPDMLKIPCLPVGEGESISHIVDKLQEAAKAFDLGDLKCYGLAANQFGFNKRVIIVKLKNGSMKTFINPVILRKKNLIDSYEKCFSRPGQDALPTKRYTDISVRDGFLGERRLKGIHAVAFQHELDHLNGILI